MHDGHEVEPWWWALALPAGLMYKLMASMWVEGLVVRDCVHQRLHATRLDDQTRPTLQVSNEHEGAGGLLHDVVRDVESLDPLLLPEPIEVLTDCVLS